MFSPEVKYLNIQYRVLHVNILDSKSDLFTYSSAVLLTKWATSALWRCCAVWYDNNTACLTHARQVSRTTHSRYSTPVCQYQITKAVSNQSQKYLQKAYLESICTTYGITHCIFYHTRLPLVLRPSAMWVMNGLLIRNVDRSDILAPLAPCLGEVPPSSQDAVLGL